MNADPRRLRLVVLALVALEAGMIALSIYLIASVPHDDSAKRREEAEAYEIYRRRFGPSQIGPAEVRSEADLIELEAALAGQLAPPPEFTEKWQNTDAVRLFRKWQTDAALVRLYQQKMSEWYRELIRRSTELRFAAKYNERWAKDAAAWLSERVPFEGVVKESTVLPQRRGAALTFADIAASDLVERAASDWAAARRRLTGLPDLLENLAVIGQRIGCWPRFVKP